MKKSRPDTPAMVFGLIFLLISGWWFVWRGVGFGHSSLGFVTAGILILLGVAGIATALRNNSRT
jgi:hypothetical protein